MRDTPERASLSLLEACMSCEFDGQACLRKGAARAVQSAETHVIQHISHVLSRVFHVIELKPDGSGTLTQSHNLRTFFFFFGGDELPSPSGYFGISAKFKPLEDVADYASTLNWKMPLRA